MARRKRSDALSGEAGRRSKPGNAAEAAGDAIAAVRDLAWAGQQEKAIAAASTALEASGLTGEARLALLDLRAESLRAVGEFDAALADAHSMQVLAKALGSAHARALAACRLSVVLMTGGDAVRAASVARGALAAARKARDTELEALALYRLASALLNNDEPASLRHAQEAAARFEQVVLNAAEIRILLSTKKGSSL